MTSKRNGRLREQSAKQKSGQQSAMNETRTTVDSNAAPSPSPPANREVQEGRTRRDAAMWRLSNGKGSSFFAEGRVAFVKLLLSARDGASINKLREVFPPRDGVSPNSYGPIVLSLRRIGWLEKVGEEPAEHRDAHARGVPRWKLTEAAVGDAAEWLRFVDRSVPNSDAGSKTQGTLFGTEGK